MFIKLQWLLPFFSTVMMNKAIAKWKLTCIHEVLMFTSFYLQSLRESKLQIVLHQKLVSWPTMSLQPEMNWFTLKVVTAVEDKRFCIFIWHIFLVPVKTSFFLMWTILWHLWSYYRSSISIRSIYGSRQYCTSLKFHYRAMSNMWLASVRGWVNLQERVF